MDKDTKKAVLALIADYTPLREHGIKLSLSSTGGGFLCITHNKPIIGTSKEFIEGLLAGARLCPTYYPDSGPFDCRTPSITWKGPK